ncbi:hypothetical protein OC842_003701 [Tilletia horrida]|uniref:Ribonuclease H1 N-terminal domain-containing protein n=1 Tax=Tilletia horrida TaxID=155126 RepID=A0AAN6GB70_9BASI|nr:hypothetical protein OC842_003701 [Tilletia horrida]
MPFWAIRRGRTRGVLDNLTDTLAAIRAFPHASHAPFDDEDDAWAFVLAPRVHAHCVTILNGSGQCSYGITWNERAFEGPQYEESGVYDCPDWGELERVELLTILRALELCPDKGDRVVVSISSRNTFETLSTHVKPTSPSGPEPDSSSGKHALHDLLHRILAICQTMAHWPRFELCPLHEDNPTVRRAHRLAWDAASHTSRCALEAHDLPSKSSPSTHSSGTPTSINPPSSTPISSSVSSSTSSAAHKLWATRLQLDEDDDGLITPKSSDPRAAYFFPLKSPASSGAGSASAMPRSAGLDSTSSASSSSPAPASDFPTGTATSPPSTGTFSRPNIHPTYRGGAPLPPRSTNTTGMLATTTSTFRSSSPVLVPTLMRSAVTGAYVALAPRPGGAVSMREWAPLGGDGVERERGGRSSAQNASRHRLSASTSSIRTRPTVPLLLDDADAEGEAGTQSPLARSSLAFYTSLLDEPNDLVESIEQMRPLRCPLAYSGSSSSSSGGSSSGSFSSSSSGSDGNGDGDGNEGEDDNEEEKGKEEEDEQVEEAAGRQHLPSSDEEEAQDDSDASTPNGRDDQAACLPRARSSHLHFPGPSSAGSSHTTQPTSPLSPFSPSGPRAGSLRLEDLMNFHERVEVEGEPCSQPEKSVLREDEGPVLGKDGVGGPQAEHLRGRSMSAVVEEEVKRAMEETVLHGT